LAVLDNLVIWQAVEGNRRKTRMPIHVPARSSLVQGAIAILLTIAIFVVDALTPLGIAIAVLYALVILLSASFMDRRGLLTVAAACIAFTLVAFFAGHGETFDADASVRCVISLCAIVVTTFLALKNQEATLQLKNQAALLELTHDAIFVRDARGMVTYWNRAAEELYGWTAEQAVGRRASDLLQPRLPVDAARAEADLLQAGRWEGEVSQVRRDGSQIMVASRWSLYRDQHRQPVATMETNSDISGRREAEDALHKARAELSHVTRLATLGELAASIAHEINQPLAAVVTNGDAGVRWLGREPPDIEEVRTSLQKMVTNARRASDVIARLRALARRADADRAELDINEVIDDTLRLVQWELAEHRIDLDLSFDPDLPYVLGDRVQLQQVIINLVMNALQAMNGVEGIRTLRIATRHEPEDDGDRVVIEVTDCGVGFEPGKAGELFAAFYTTKSNGMGMGLSISRSIVEAHRGQINASTNQAGGSTFVVRLPASAEGVV
jgi:PAS domain S-box-containing protein